ncbi:cystathionine beta-synthase [Bradysia coprophila]|uniref:cystathionine beta-synthase n=1 Tax=Bradysia coprophila TaxID=38358 RepID=UPI00187D910F|nr:cystathionine beta-synthase [Bradysia coprophila]XP_037027962.1 cystathionine beta-synthase [Bradysia coprophila]XP_037027963.1 cystathionine beta-synthase [Bradysia coprophila]XP_037027964.1 cystathionine beta-synthase [Bradysia coprophila]XP_037027965.1 cystathionine beta-synthase [Bradysia coprophila]XP_037027966.1 cystathionine beta-synthase [Bradysia coprophila]
MATNGEHCPVGNGLPDYFVAPNKATRCSWKLIQERNPHFNRSYFENPKILPDILHAIGNTPLVKLNTIPQAEGVECDIYAKCEFLNPGGSVKDRIGYRMVQDAEAKGLLKPGCTIIEPTSGNTGIGLAMACAVKGYKCLIVMPEKMSNEKVAALQTLGAKIVRTPTEAAWNEPAGLIARAQMFQHEIPNSIVLDQYRNPGNPLAHYDGTGEEILRQCGGSVDMVVVGAGTGGTISGIGRKIKEKCPDCKVIACDPEGSILSLPDSLNQTDVSFYEVEGIGYDFIPTVLDRSVVDKWYKCNDKQSLPLARRINAEEGILSGGSSGAALSVALRAVKDFGLKKGQRCVVILPDGIRNYMTKFVSDNWMEARLLKEPVNEHNHWWWNHKVSEIKVPALVSVKPTDTCEAAINLMSQNNLSHVAVVSDDGTLAGTVTLALLTKKVVTFNLPLTSTVESALFKQFRQVPSNTNLGLVSRILEIDDFVIVEAPLSVVTRMDVLNFIKGGKTTNGAQQ